MSERLTDAEEDALYKAVANVRGLTIDQCDEAASRVFAATERILAGRLAARGAGDGLAGRVAALADRWRVRVTNLRRATGDWEDGKETLCCIEDVRALLDPDAQGADETTGRVME